MMAHPDSPADVFTPPRRLLVPSGEPVGGVRALIPPSSIHCTCGPLKHGARVEDQQPAGTSTRAASASTAPKSSTSVDIHIVATAGKLQSAKGKAAASPRTIRAERPRAMDWSAGNPARPRSSRWR